MAFQEQHELHKRRFGRNLWLGVVLAAFVALVFGLTIVKVGGDRPDAAPDQAPAATEASQ